MTPREQLNRLLESYTGIEVARGGIDASVDAFLARRLPQARIPCLEEYLARLSPQGAELERLLDAITVTHTWFMRDPGQLAIASELFARPVAAAPPLKVWVPGCASGEDVYSLAILAERASRAVEILGTDINSPALEQARAGVYGSWSVRELSDVDSYFERGPGGTFRIASRLKAAARFERHNLVDPPPRRGWDLVLCRNVLIYLARDRARAVIEALAESLAPGGHLLLGASEVLFEVPPPLEATYIAGRLALRRNDRSARASQPPAAAPGRWHAPVAAVPGFVSSVTEPPPRSTGGPLGPAALLLRGHELLDRSDLSAAIVEYQLAVDADPTLAEPHLYLGIALYLDGNLPGALHELRAAALLDPALWPAMFYSAVCHEALGQLEEATREYRNVVRVSSRASATRMPRRHSAWHRELIQLAKKRAGSAA